MKRKIVFTLLCMCCVLSYSQQKYASNPLHIDTNNLIKPLAFNLECLSNSYVGCGIDYFLGNFFDLGDDSINIVSIAQPMHVDTLSAIKSLVYHAQLSIWLGSALQFSFPDSNYTYFQIWDANFSNLLYEINYDSVYRNEANNHHCILREIIFDSSIVVNGDFYIVQTFDPYHRCRDVDNFYYTGLSPMMIHKTKCENEDDKYPHALIKLANSDEWIYPDVLPNYYPSISVYPYITYRLCDVSIIEFYPKVDTAFDWQTWNAQNSSGLVELESKMDVTLYPNPAKNELNIVGNSNIESVEIVNSLGVLLKRTETNTKTCKIDIADFPTGVYFVTIHTPNGTSTKKFVKE